jgi:prepilin-type N-terminal cleavage/methylation domain-containing protein
MRVNLHTARAAFTLPEMLVAMGIGTMVMLFAASFYVFSMRSFTSMANFTDLDVKNRMASDLISRDLRSATSVQSLQANQLVLNEPGGINCTYTYSAARGTLTRSDGSRTQVLLTQIASNSFAFSFYARPSTNSLYESFPTNAPNGAKLVGFKWTCTRSVMAGSPANSSRQQMGLVSLRNQ